MHKCKFANANNHLCKYNKIISTVVMIALLITVMGGVFTLPSFATPSECIIQSGTYQFNDVLSEGAFYLPSLNFTLKTFIPFLGMEINAYCSGMRIGETVDGGCYLDYIVERFAEDLSDFGISLPFDMSVYSALDNDGWSFNDFGEGIQTITISNDSEVSSDFAEWFDNNTKLLNSEESDSSGDNNTSNPSAPSIGNNMDLPDVDKNQHNFVIFSPGVVGDRIKNKWITTLSTYEFFTGAHADNNFDKLVIGSPITYHIVFHRKEYFTGSAYDPYNQPNSEFVEITMEVWIEGDDTGFITPIPDDYGDYAPTRTATRYYGELKQFYYIDEYDVKDYKVIETEYAFTYTCEWGKSCSHTIFLYNPLVGWTIDIENGDDILYPDNPWHDLDSTVPDFNYTGDLSIPTYIILNAYDNMGRGLIVSILVMALVSYLIYGRKG